MLHPRSFLVPCLTLLVLACGKSGEPAPAGGTPAPSGGAAFAKELTQQLVDGIDPGPGFERGLKNASSDGFMLSFKGPANAQGAHPNLVISGLNCFASLCPELSASAWKANEANLKMKLSEALAANPALVFEIGETTVDGKKAVSVYALSFVAKTDDTGTSRASTNSYDLYWHDGAKLVNVSTNAGSTGATSVEELKAKMPRADLEALAHKALSLVLAKL